MFLLRHQYPLGQLFVCWSSRKATSTFKFDCVCVCKKRYSISGWNCYEIFARAFNGKQILNFLQSTFLNFITTKEVFITTLFQIANPKFSFQINCFYKVHFNKYNVNLVAAKFFSQRIRASYIWHITSYVSQNLLSPRQCTQYLPQLVSLLIWAFYNRLPWHDVTVNMSVFFVGQPHLIPSFNFPCNFFILVHSLRPRAVF